MVLARDVTCPYCGDTFDANRVRHRCALISNERQVVQYCPTCGNEICARCGTDHRFGADHLFEGVAEETR